MTKNILITGTGGFVGKNLKEWLGEKYNLFTPRSFELELTNFETVQKYFQIYDIDFVIHCANKGGARGVSDDRSVVEDNLKMFHNLQKCLQGKRMIFFGSGAQYDRFRPLIKIKEENLGEFIPQDPYGYSKFLIAKEIEKSDNILCLNIFGSYGKWEKENRFPSDAISKNLQKEPIVINKNVVFDYLYIDDLCRIVEYFVEHQPSEKNINITPTQSIDLLKISNIVNEISDFKSKIILKNEGLNNEYTGDNSRFLQEMGNFKFKTYEEGIKDLFEILQRKRELTHEF
ncbi:MAG: NAD(P)-dependent oxidoreductase [bacterium]